MAISDDTANAMSAWYTNSLSGTNNSTGTTSGSSTASTTANTTPSTAAAYDSGVWGNGSSSAAATPAASAQTASTGSSSGTTAKTATSNTASTGTTGTTGSTTASSTPAVDISQWYTDITGRKADAQGAAYWQNRLSNLQQGENADSIYSEFINSAKANGDYAPGTYQSGPSTLDLDSLQTRNVDSNQTVSGQLQGLLDANSDYIQSARDAAVRQANSRGLSNSSIAATAGQAAAYEAAVPIATSDASAYQTADAYNAALYNQGLMYNTDAENAYITQQNANIQSDKTLATQNAQSDKTLATQNAQADKTLATQNTQSDKTLAAQLAADKETQSANLASQQAIAQIQAETSRYQAELSDATSRYNTDSAYKQQVDSNKNTLVNNIIQTTDLSPDRKAELLKQLGEPGLASAIYVASDIASELQS